MIAVAVAEDLPTGLRCNSCGEGPAQVQIAVGVAENARSVTRLCGPCAADLGAGLAPVLRDLVLRRRRAREGA